VTADVGKQKPGIYTLKAGQSLHINTVSHVSLANILKNEK
jgi:hypothetical protein